MLDCIPRRNLILNILISLHNFSPQTLIANAKIIRMKHQIALVGISCKPHQFRDVEKFTSEENVNQVRVQETK